MWLGSGQQRGQALAEDRLGVGADPAHPLPGRLDGVDQAGGLADRQGGVVATADLARAAEPGADLGAPLPELVPAPAALLDQTMAQHPRVGASPDAESTARGAAGGRR